jgi:hypothetical protein
MNENINKKGFWNLIVEKSGGRRIQIIFEIILEDGKRTVYVLITGGK